jgi:hypothetical protein
MAVEIHEIKPFGIPSEHLRRPIHPAILEDFGYNPQEDPNKLLLSPVLVRGASYGGGTGWEASATSARPEEIETSDYGRIQIQSDRRLSSTDALDAADDWIRKSPTTLFVPGHIIKIPLPADQDPYFMNGILLVRAEERPTPDHPQC